MLAKVVLCCKSEDFSFKYVNTMPRLLFANFCLVDDSLFWNTYLIKLMKFYIIFFILFV